MIRSPDDLYDELMQLAQPQGETIHDVVQTAARFWLIISGDAEETRTSMTGEEEAMVSAFLRFLRRADTDSVAAVTHIMAGWRRRELPKGT